MMSAEMVTNHVLFFSPKKFEDAEYMPLADIAGDLSKDDFAIIEEHVTTAVTFMQDKGMQCTAITEKCIYVKKVRTCIFLVISLLSTYFHYFPLLTLHLYQSSKFLNKASTPFWKKFLLPKHLFNTRLLTGFHV